MHLTLHYTLIMKSGLASELLTEGIIDNAGFMDGQEAHDKHILVCFVIMNHYLSTMQSCDKSSTRKIFQTLDRKGREDFSHTVADHSSERKIAKEEYVGT